MISEPITMKKIDFIQITKTVKEICKFCRS